MNIKKFKNTKKNHIKNHIVTKVSKLYLTATADIDILYQSQLLLHRSFQF